MTDILQTGERRRRAQHQDASPAEPSIAIMRDDLYVVLGARETMGFIERVGGVFVALCGPDLERAVEVGQSRSWDRSVGMGRTAYAG